MKNQKSTKNLLKGHPPLLKKKTMEIPDEFQIKENKFKKYFDKPYKLPCNKQHLF
jgi:hypothetical protein